MESSDFQKFELFKERTMSLTEYAKERNTSLYVDAEQSFLQYGIESFGQQLTHKFNQDDTTMIMNGYQCYTKRAQDLISMEVACAKQFGFNLGVKLIRGAYMLEERELA
jgi:proline dehydrogenase